MDACFFPQFFGKHHLTPLVIGDGHEFMRFSELGGGPPLIDGHARRTRRAPVCMIRKDRYAALGQGQMIVVEYLERFEARSTAHGSF